MTDELLKKNLEIEKAKLEKEMANIGVRTSATTGTYVPKLEETGAEPDLGDQADALESRAENTAILSDLEARYREVLAALERFARGIYGHCVVCGDEIETARLAADPAATTCAKHLVAMNNY